MPPSPPLEGSVSPGYGEYKADFKHNLTSAYVRLNLMTTNGELSSRLVDKNLVLCNIDGGHLNTSRIYHFEILS